MACNGQGRLEQVLKLESVPLILSPEKVAFFSQVCPQADVVELLVYLAEPCHVCQLLVTISHGADDSTYPSTVDVRTGQDLDSLKLVVEVYLIFVIP